ncbi:MAG: hypothetical protein QOD77_293 [Thermoplasmata archaeon]|jgi:hypothetical protein|nr:hypothetical protein [Thermoplasmata archaeon]
MRFWTMALAALMVATALAGCAQDTDSDGDGLMDAREQELGTNPELADTDGDALGDADEVAAGTDATRADTDGDGVLDGVELTAGTDPLQAAPALSFRLSRVGRDGPEPSIGVTDSGCMFFVALQDLMRSCDQGKSWEQLTSPFLATDTSDPYLWVDPVTDRVFSVQMVNTQSCWISWSDDDGATWLGNPLDCGPNPSVDHMKVATGPWTDAGFGAAGKAAGAYDQAVYVCRNTGVVVVGTVTCYTSLDGGATFEAGASGTGVAMTNAGLHGAITTAPDGTVYVPPRLESPGVLVSKDNGFSWTYTELGKDAGTPSPRKNSEVATDSASNAYFTWVGKDARTYLSRSTDGGGKWDALSLVASAPSVVSTTFPHIQAGDPGRIAVAYLGSEDAALLGTDNIDGDPWDGNPHTAPAAARYHLWVSFSLDALSANPTWTHVRVTDDPVQVGSICISSGDCRDLGGSNRNLLDFNDLSLDKDGRVFVAFADGCTSDDCVGPDGKPEDSRDREGVVAILEDGPSLYAEKGPLAPL